MKISIIIVSYNVRHYLDQCLDSVTRAIQGLEAEIFVVDNKSCDMTVELLEVKYPNVCFIENSSNVGFAKANNQAIRKSTGEYILLLNPDTILGEDTLKAAISSMDTDKTIGGAGVKMLKHNGGFALESRRGIPTPWTAFCKMSGLGTLLPRSKKFGRYYMQYLDKEKISDIEIISGACMFLRRSALDKAGLLDETFFMYGEDIDLSYRLIKAGYRNIYIPSTILHYKGESTQKASFKYVNSFYTAMLIFFKKHFGGRSILLSLPIKATIYAKGFLNYLWQQIKKVCDNHDTLYYIKKSKFLLLGSSGNLENMIEKCDKLGLNFDSMLAEGRLREEGHTALTGKGLNYDYIIYDMSAFNYATMLNAFEKTGKEKPSPMIATYHSDGNTIITGSIIL